MYTLEENSCCSAIEEQTPETHSPDSGAEFQDVHPSDVRNHGHDLRDLFLAELFGVRVQHHLFDGRLLGMLSPVRVHIIARWFDVIAMRITCIDYTRKRQTLSYWLTLLRAWYVVERLSVFDRRTFPVLRSTCSWRVTIYVGKPSGKGQSTRPTRPFIIWESIDE